MKCTECGTEIAPLLLSCPRCRRLVYALELKALAAEADHAERQGNLTNALSCWRGALEKLPEDSRQREIVREKIVELSRRLDEGPAAGTKRPSPAKRTGWLAGLGAAGLLLWKLKTAVAFVLTKGKILLLGLTKSSTLFSMILSLGVYWSMWGWWFALGVILSLYIHEMGHVAMLRHYGIRASAPMFIPGFGAFVRLDQYPATPREDARVGLAGPIWGLGAALVSAAVFWATGLGIWGAIARFGAWVNLFNLIPFWQLDGGRGFRSLSRVQRWIAVAGVAAALLASGDGMLILILMAAVVRALSKDAPRESDPAGLVQYVVLIAALTALIVALPGAPGR